MIQTAGVTAPASRSIARAELRYMRARDFRNLVSVDARIAPAGMALVGDNAQGKTNFLEAVYYLQLLRSFRGDRDQELVRFGTSGFHLTGAIAGPGPTEIAVGFERPASGKGSGRKRARLNGVEPPRLSDALGILPSVIFSPRDAVIITGAPGERRRFLDVMLALTSRPYLTALQRYRAALANRNAALRSTRPGQGDDAVAVWEPALAESGAVLWNTRTNWVASHSARFTELSNTIGENGEAELQYRPRAHSTDASFGFEVTLREWFERKRALDIRRGITHIGPHRDELAILLNGRDLQGYASAGQQRTAAIALRLLEAETLRAAAAMEPVVLLDDPFAELDARRSCRILDLLNSASHGQTLLAVPRTSDIPEGFTRLERWRVTDGVLAREHE
ncbi:MAG: DNA replication and repair protein RecF [Gemmatimonadaceae bacterium]|nr:DNA replication and repair protein RecF [Gemmatimonadaceae bacterium]